MATALSVKAGKTLPWRAGRDVIGAALQARFLELAEGSQGWPCEFPSAPFVKLKVSRGVGAGAAGYTVPTRTQILMAEAELTPSEIQELGDLVPELLTLKAKATLPIRFHIRVELGDGKTLPPEEVAKNVNALLKKVREDLGLR